MAVEQPALWYFGGKWAVAPKIIEWFPPHETYVEPFGGGASTLLRKDRATVEVYNDIYSDAVNFFRVMRDHAGELLFRIYCTPFSRDEYARCLEYDGDDPIEMARVFFAISRQSYAPSGINPTGWKRRRESRAPVLSLNTLMQIVDRLRGVYIENQDFRDIIKWYDSTRTLFYVDPPYLEHGLGYIHYMSKQDHIDLAHILAGVEGFAILSAMDSDLYRQLYADWIWMPLKVHNLGRIEANSEFLIMNYEFY